ncbi:hypothetical protein GCM10018952_10290 [Streptosporangium vulgare]
MPPPGAPHALAGHPVGLLSPVSPAEEEEMVTAAPGLLVQDGEGFGALFAEPGFADDQVLDRRVGQLSGDDRLGVRRLA